MDNIIKKHLKKKRRKTSKPTAFLIYCLRLLEMFLKLNEIHPESRNEFL